MTPAAASDVRTWARGQGLTSAVRGPLPRAVLEAYAAAHPGGAAAPQGQARRRRTPAQRRPGIAPAATVAAVTAAPTGSGDLEGRLARVEAQLATALARLATLEAEAPRSLLGLHVTL